MKVYVVTEGEYSDYHIDSIFSTKEKADIRAALLNSTAYNSAEVEEWDADDVEIDTCQKIIHYATVHYCRGEITRVIFSDGIDGVIKFDQPIKIDDRCAFVNVRTDDMDKAKKIFYDKYAEALYEYATNLKNKYSEED